jgi:hypothetical protein
MVRKVFNTHTRRNCQVKPLKGAYRIRWTGVDGYREFPVTVTE